MINIRKLSFAGINYYRMALGYGDISFCPELLDVLVDFRNPQEAVRNTTIAKCCINLPMTDAGSKYRNIRIPCINDLLEFYIEIVERYQPEFRQLNTIVSSNKLVGFGCYFGKDRTGIASYFLSKMYGLPWEGIIYDYEQSGIELIKNIDYFSSHWEKRNITKQDYMNRLKTDGKAILQLDDYIIKKYGSVANYLIS
ncbi:tyrosine-protein phosphatase [Photorhabdus asymbiotica]|uniref:tyrosine-protein phosphatase n=1 Tax=Photorhabdus asymbiotica TaxID=291112 RepID=UPI003DA6D92E